MIYNYCENENCKKDYNKYFCKNCLKNICDNCYEKCKIEIHDIVNLEKMKEESISNIKIIKKFLNNNIIPIKDVNENLTKEENNEDIFLIIEIISQDYINYFHLENIRRILKYIDFYSNKPMKMCGFFLNCSSLISLPDISKWNIEKVETMDSIFSGCSSLLSLPNISKWNMKNVININKMFNDCSSLSSLPDISLWNTEKVTDMSELFSGCKSLSSLPDISKWKTQNIDKIEKIFYGCISLSSLPDISKWEIKEENKLHDDCLSLLSFSINK